ncbi:MAG: rhamnulokinase [Candidatus Thermofonsia Clade 1 bacterium]|jgi:rhamnulokinase|uniref:Rhamnulokinase n=1 Tax=Candidatus Thermofonsia Clade 1 bacterium TaxID=2364210 RepID=A0A2M8PF44_9CHLR|nr:MAG: rhamnulokinase [Candidatus Thermofonsia Clade 1 bacterium]RMF49198.1 MAG: rhamnulokinase [Chloroflexota bacterium]
MTDLIAVDLGNESGRIFRVRFDGRQVQGTERYRFANVPVSLRGTLYWDALRLWQEIERGLAAAQLETAAGIGVDSFGVDFGLLDRRGALLSNPVHMRDKRTEGIMEQVLALVPRQELYQRTGIGFYVINTLYQLVALQRDAPELLELTDTLLTMPNLILYWMTGEKVNEFTHTTTTQCYNPTLGDWDRELLRRLGLPTHFLPTVVQPANLIGLYSDVPVFTVASHDTASAVVAVPTESEHFAYISSGTWSLIGVETRQPILTEPAMNANITNEGGAFGTFRPLKMVMGLWLVQQCRARWQQQGQNVAYETLLSEAQQAQPFLALIDPDDPAFFAHGDMPARIADFCRATEQPVPETQGAIVRCILESLALKYRYALEQIVAATGRQVEALHIVGGGSQNALLCQMTADAIGKVVYSGPIEATVLGNALVQLVALGELRDLAEARQVVRASYPPLRYTPSYLQDWEGAYARFRRLVTSG